MLDATPPVTSKPTLLFLCHRLPYPPDKGEKIRAFRILEHLSRHYRVFLGCFVDDVADTVHVKALEGICAEVKWFPLSPRVSKYNAVRGLIGGSALSVASFWNADMQTWVTRCIRNENPQVIFVYSSAMAQFVGNDRGQSRFLMDFVDVDSDKWRQYAETATFPMSWVYAREARKLLEFDRRVADAADASIFVSDAEAELFRTLSPVTAKKTHSVANGVDCDFFSPSHHFETPFNGPGPHLVFTGTMNYRPNVDAVTWFANIIFPLIRSSQPDATFTIVGAKPSHAVTALGTRAGIFVTGRVSDVRPFLAMADVVVAPLRIARGIQNKVLEGMAMAKPVVTTPQGLEGIAAQPGQHLLVAESAQEFAAAVLEVIATRGSPVGGAARHLMETSYGWPSRLAALDQLISQ